MENKVENVDTSSYQRIIWLRFALLLVGLFAIGFAPILMKFSISEITPNATIFNRFWIASLVFGIWSTRQMICNNSSNDISSGQEKLYSPKTVGMILLAGSFLAGIQLMWAWSLSRTSVASSVTILHGLRPLLTALGGWILFKNRYDSKFLFGMIMASIGAVLIGFNDFSESIYKLQGDFLSVLSAIFSALELLIIERLLTQFTTQTLMFWFCAISSLITIIFLITTGDIFFPVSWRGWLAVIGLALVCQVIGQGLITYSLNYLSPAFVAVSMVIDPIISSLFAWMILNEKLTILTSIFCCIVLLGIYLSLSSQYAVKTEEIA
ncbi:MAG: EamA family transporter [Nostoc sp. RI_552]|nr:EamA family transporter [Nostoc sp. RI_552]